MKNFRELSVQTFRIFSVIFPDFGLFVRFVQGKSDSNPPFTVGFSHNRLANRYRLKAQSFFARSGIFYKKRRFDK